MVWFLYDRDLHLDMLCKLMDWFPYDKDLPLQRVILTTSYFYLSSELRLYCTLTNSNKQLLLRHSS